MNSKPCILVVDDELNIRRILQMAFDKVGYQTLVAEDAREAIKLLESEKFDLVITDVTMPGMNGYDLQKQIQQVFPDLPVIIMTAFGTIPQAVAAIRNGAFEYITKPFDLDQLKRIVSAALEGDTPKKRTAKPKVVSERSRKRSGCQSTSYTIKPCQETIHRSQQCSPSREPFGKRTVWLRKGRLHRSNWKQNRSI